VQAEEYLANSSWDYESAVTEYYNPAEDVDQPQETQASSSTPQPIPTASNMPPVPSAPPKKKFATLGDLRAGPPGHEGHGHDDDDSDDDDSPPDLYAGGEKSGLAVENPDDLKKKIIERAKRSDITHSTSKSPRHSLLT